MDLGPVFAIGPASKPISRASWPRRRWRTTRAGPRGPMREATCSSGGASGRRGRPGWWERRTLHEEAAAHAIAWLAACCPELEPDKDKVLELLRRRRTAWPGTAYN